MHNQKKPHHQLIAWQEAMRLVKEVYKITKLFPKDEVYSLTSQIRRCAISIPSNIAEGAGRGSKAELVRFLDISRGSLSELETQLLIAVDQDYIKDDNAVFESLDRVSRLLTGLRKKYYVKK